MNQLRYKAKKLASTFIALLNDRCDQYGFKIIGPDNDDLRGGHVSICHENGYAIMQAIKDRGLIGDFRAPDVLRFGITPLYMTFQNIYDAVEIISDVMRTEAWDNPAYMTQAEVT
jgi:kynureninase